MRADVIDFEVHLRLLPHLTPWACVLITFTDLILVLLFMRGDETRKAMTAFEFAITLLVFVTVIAALILLIQVKPDWGYAFKGFIPSSHLFESQILYLTIAIMGQSEPLLESNLTLDLHDWFGLRCDDLETIWGDPGAIISPHSLFLGSSLATQPRLDQEPNDLELHSVSHHLTPSRDCSTTVTNLDWPEASISSSRTISSVQTYLRHASFDIAASFMTLPLSQSLVFRSSPRELRLLAHMMISWHFFSSSSNKKIVLNTSIVIIGCTEFHGEQVADLIAVHVLLQKKQGKVLSTIYAIALLVSAQAAGLSGTLAGQTISNGLLGWKPKPVIRRTITRLMGAIPALLVAHHGGIPGLGALLVRSQAAISIVIPWVFDTERVMCFEK